MNRLLVSFAAFSIGLFSSSISHADIISATSGIPSLASVGPITNSQIDFTNFNAAGCAGVKPCIVGASTVPITLFESGFTAPITFKYGPNFDFNYGSTGPGDRLILRYMDGIAGFSLNLSLSGGSFYLGAPPLGIPDLGTPGLSQCPSLNPTPGHQCYTFSQQLTSTSGPSTVFVPTLPFKGSPSGNEVDLYVAIDGLNPNGGTFTLNSTAGIAPEPSTLILFGTGLLGLAGIARRRIRR